MISKCLTSICTIALFAVAPLAVSAAASPKPMMMGSMHMTHQCRDAKGHFIKGKYVKCPAGTHKAM